MCVFCSFIWKLFWNLCEFGDFLFNIWFRLQLSFQFGWWWSSMKFLPRDIVVLQQNADSLRSLLSPSSSKRFIIWMSLYGQLYYFLKIFRTLRLSSTKLLGLTPHQKQWSVVEWPIYWYTTVTLSNRDLTVVWAGYGSGIRPTCQFWMVRTSLMIYRYSIFPCSRKNFSIVQTESMFNYDLSQISRPMYSKSRKI